MQYRCKLEIGLSERILLSRWFNLSISMCCGVVLQPGRHQRISLHDRQLLSYRFNERSALSSRLFLQRRCEDGHGLCKRQLLPRGIHSAVGLSRGLVLQ